MKIDVNLLMNIVMSELVEMYNSDYDRVEARFEALSAWEGLDYDILLSIVDEELELFNSQRDGLRLAFKTYLNNL